MYCFAAIALSLCTSISSKSWLNISKYALLSSPRRVLKSPLTTSDRDDEDILNIFILGSAVLRVKLQCGRVSREDKLNTATAQYEAVEAELNVIVQEMEEAMERSSQLTVSIDEAREGASGIEEQAAQLESADPASSSVWW